MFAAMGRHWSRFSGLSGKPLLLHSQLKHTVAAAVAEAAFVAAATVAPAAKTAAAASTAEASTSRRSGNSTSNVVQPVGGRAR